MEEEDEDEEEEKKGDLAFGCTRSTIWTADVQFLHNARCLDVQANVDLGRFHNQ